MITVRSSIKFHHTIKLISLPVIFLLLCASLYGCSPDRQTASIKLGEPFTLSASQSVKISGEDMAITFNKVSGDSRCPLGANCIWAGAANSSITIDYKGASYAVTLELPGLSEDAATLFQNYKLVHSLSPYPKVGEPIEENEYRLTITVEKQ